MVYSCNYHHRKAELGSRILLIFWNICWLCLFLPFSRPQNLYWSLIQSKSGAQKKITHSLQNCLFWPLKIRIVDMCNKPELIWLANKGFLLIYHMLEHLEEKTKATTEAKEVKLLYYHPRQNSFSFHDASVLIFTWKLRIENFFLYVTSPRFFLIIHYSYFE